MGGLLRAPHRWLALLFGLGLAGAGRHPAARRVLVEGGGAVRRRARRRPAASGPAGWCSPPACSPRSSPASTPGGPGRGRRARRRSRRPAGPVGRTADVPAGGPTPAEPVDAHEPAPAAAGAMTWPLWVLAVPTVLLGLVLITPPPALLAAIHVERGHRVHRHAARRWPAWAGRSPRPGSAAWTSPTRCRPPARAVPARGVPARRRPGRAGRAAVPARWPGVVGQGDRDVVDAYVRGVGGWPPLGRPGAAPGPGRGWPPGTSRGSLLGAVVVGCRGWCCVSVERVSSSGPAGGCSPR